MFNVKVDFRFKKQTKKEGDSRNRMVFNQEAGRVNMEKEDQLFQQNLKSSLFIELLRKSIFKFNIEEI